MILTCPECATRYEIDSAKFPAAGRKVRCKKCGHVWFQAGESGAVDQPPAPSEPPPAPAIVEEPPRPAPPIFATEPGNDPEDDAPPARAYRGTVTASESFAPEPVAAKKAKAANRNSLRLAALVVGWIALIGAVLMIALAATSYRQQVAHAWPKSSSLFAHIGMPVNTRGLDFADVRHMSQSEDGQPVLVITGKLVNVSARAVDVPTLHVTLSDAGKNAIYDWSFSAAAHVLAPGQAAAFHTRLSNPPPAARHVDIRFADAGQ